jgi:hypothetical protein
MVDEVKYNPETRISIDNNEVVIIKSDVKNNDKSFYETINNYESARSIKCKKRLSRNVLSSDSGTTFYEKKDFQIEICQDGKFVVTFDTGKFVIS